MNNKFLALFCREFSGRLRQIWLFPLAAALFQPALYWLAVREMYESARFEELYLSSAAPILLAVLFAALTGWMVWMTVQDFSNGSICTLLTLPGGRGRLWLAKLSAFCGALLLLWAGILAGIGLSYLVFSGRCAEIARITGQDYRLNAGLWLGLTRAALFRILCPMTLPEIVSSLLLFLTLPLTSAWAGWAFAGRHYVRGGLGSIAAACLWALLLRERLLYPEEIPLPYCLTLPMILAAVAADSLQTVRRADF